MDETNGIKKLSELWDLARAKGVTLSRTEFIDAHSLQIRRQNKGYWVIPDATAYIEKLEESILS